MYRNPLATSAMPVQAIIAVDKGIAIAVSILILSFFLWCFCTNFSYFLCCCRQSIICIPIIVGTIKYRPDGSNCNAYFGCVRLDSFCFCSFGLVFVRLGFTSSLRPKILVSCIISRSVAVRFPYSILSNRNGSS